MQIKVSVPTDADGCLDLRCPTCEGKFKLQAEDFQDEATIEFWCPLCGLRAPRALYTDPQVIEAAKAHALNYAKQELNRALGNLQRSTSGNRFLKIEVKPFTSEPVRPVRTITDLALVNVPCCNRSLKVPFSAGAALFYCPFCGNAQT